MISTHLKSKHLCILEKFWLMISTYIYLSIWDHERYDYDGLSWSNLGIPNKYTSASSPQMFPSTATIMKWFWWRKCCLHLNFWVKEKSGRESDLFTFVSRRPGCILRTSFETVVKVDKQMLLVNPSASQPIGTKIGKQQFNQNFSLFMKPNLLFQVQLDENTLRV